MSKSKEALNLYYNSNNDLLKFKNFNITVTTF